MLGCSIFKISFSGTRKLLLAIYSEIEIELFPAETWTHLTAKDLMTADPITVKADVLVVKALAQMEHNRRKPISVLPVVNQEHQLMGLLRLHDLVQAGLA